jgi:hypothetical protein
MPEVVYLWRLFLVYFIQEAGVTIRYTPFSFSYVFSFPYVSTIHHATQRIAWQNLVTGACSVAASYKPPMLVTRVRLPACA